MRTVECVEFLQKALPELGLRWAGFRKVRGLVCKRLGKRFAELGLTDLAAYRAYVELHPPERHKLEEMCRIPISRFYRDRAVFMPLERDVLPALAAEAIAQGRHELRCWSACCASGEEPYTLSILWHLRLASTFPGLKLRIAATDVDPNMLRRARIGCYRASSIKDLPEDLMRPAFERSGEQYCVRTALRTVDFLQQDIRESIPDGPFDLILCRNAVLTYFLAAEQQEVMERVIARLEAGGALVIGLHETLPPLSVGLASWTSARAIYRAPSAAE